MKLPLTLQEASKIISADDFDPFTLNQDIQDFMNSVEDAGRTVLAEKFGDNADSFLSDAADFVQAMTTAEILKQRPQIGVAMLKNPGTFRLIVAYAFIYSVGLTITEELR